MLSRSVQQMRRTIRKPSALVVVIVVAAGGCGSSQKQPTAQQRQQIIEVLHSYLRAQTAGDGQAACSLLTNSAQRELEMLALQVGGGQITSQPSCQDAVGLVRAVAGKQLLDALSSAQIADVQVHSDSATAQILTGGAFGQQQVSLQRSGGSWKIDGVFGLAQ